MMTPRSTFRTALALAIRTVDPEAEVETLPSGDLQVTTTCQRVHVFPVAGLSTEDLPNLLNKMREDRKVNPEAKAQLLAALRSGEYKPAEGLYIRDEDKFSVAAVALDLTGEAEWVGKPGATMQYGTDWGQQMEILKQRYGFPYLCYQGSYRSLLSMTYLYDLGFEGFASMIEEQW